MQTYAAKSWTASSCAKCGMKKADHFDSTRFCVRILFQLLGNVTFFLASCDCM